jgi:hypothetical protein
VFPAASHASLATQQCATRLSPCLASRFRGAGGVGDGIPDPGACSASGLRPSPEAPAAGGPVQNLGISQLRSAGSPVRLRKLAGMCGAHIEYIQLTTLHRLPSERRTKIPDDPRGTFLAHGSHDPLRAKDYIYQAVLPSHSQATANSCLRLFDTQRIRSSRRPDCKPRCIRPVSDPEQTPNDGSRSHPFRFGKSCFRSMSGAVDARMVHE